MPPRLWPRLRGNGRPRSCSTTPPGGGGSDGGGEGGNSDGGGGDGGGGDGGGGDGVDPGGGGPYLRERWHGYSSKPGPHLARTPGVLLAAAKLSWNRATPEFGQASRDTISSIMTCSELLPLRVAGIASPVPLRAPPLSRSQHERSERPPSP